MSEAVIRCSELKKHYQLGGETVRALDGVSVTIERGRVRGHHGPVRKREVDVHEPAGVSRHTHGGGLLAQR